MTCSATTSRNSIASALAASSAAMPANWPITTWRGRIPGSAKKATSTNRSSMSVTRKASGPASQPRSGAMRRPYGVNCSSSFQPLSMNCDRVRCVAP